MLRLNYRIAHTCCPVIPSASLSVAAPDSGMCETGPYLRSPCSLSYSPVVVLSSTLFFCHHYFFLIVSLA